MSDYTVQASWDTKDALAAGSALKAISATELGTEFDAIAAAIITKLDTADLPTASATEAGIVELATTAEVVTGTDTTRAVTAAGVEAWGAQNAGMVQDIANLGDPAADTVLGWDDSAGAIINVTLGSGIGMTVGGALSIDHDATANFVANEHINHTGVDIIAGAGMTGGGDITTSRTLNVIAGDGITVNANDVQVDATVVRTTGAQSLAGIKTFTDGIQLNDGDTLHIGTGDDIQISATGTTGTINAPNLLNVRAATLVLGGDQVGDELGFFSGAVSATLQTVSGSKDGNAALASLLDALAAYGLVSDGSS